MTIIAVDGPDFAGKTTLCNKLAAEYYAAVYHNGSYPGLTGEELMAAYSEQIDDALARESYGYSTVFDRTWIGELVYGPHYRGSSRIAVAQAKELDDRLTRAGAVKLFVDAPDILLLERFRGARGDDLVTKEDDLLQIAQTYRDMLRGTIFSGWLYWPHGMSLIAGWQ